MRKIITLLMIILLPTSLVAQVNQTAENRSVVLRNVTLIDMKDEQPKPNMTVVISGNRITEIGKSVKIPRNSQIIDAGGKFLMLGLWDMHVHPLASSRWEWATRVTYGARAEETMLREREREIENRLKMAFDLHRGGSSLLAGTDADSNFHFVFYGFSLHEELELFVKAGLTPMEALRTATVNPARFLKAEDSLGTIEKGKLADLVLLDANPLDDIKNTTKIRAVLFNGRYFDRQALDDLLKQAEKAANP